MRPFLAVAVLGGGLVLGADFAAAQICVQDNQGRVLCGNRIHPDFAQQGAPVPQVPQTVPQDVPQPAPQFGDEDEDEFDAAYPPRYQFAPGYGAYPPPPPYWRHRRWHDRGYAVMREWYPIGPGGRCPPNFTIQHGRCEPYRGR